MVEKVLHVWLNNEVPETTGVQSLGSGVIPTTHLGVEFGANGRFGREAFLVLHVPLKYVDLEVVGNDKEGGA